MLCGLPISNRNSHIIADHHYIANCSWCGGFADCSEDAPLDDRSLLIVGDIGEVVCLEAGTCVGGDCCKFQAQPAMSPVGVTTDELQPHLFLTLGNAQYQTQTTPQCVCAKRDPSLLSLGSRSSKFITILAKVRRHPVQTCGSRLICKYPRYKLHAPRPDEWFPSMDAMATISVVDLKDRSTFDGQIPAAYLFHIHWIMREAFPEEESEGNQRDRCMWLCGVLDTFAEEIRTLKGTPDWRSVVLNPILVRALYGVDHFNEKAINAEARRRCQLTGTKMTIKHWEGFYFNLDVVAPTHHAWWLLIKHVEHRQRVAGRVEIPIADPLEGDVLHSWHTSEMSAHKTNLDGRITTDEETPGIRPHDKTLSADEEGYPSREGPTTPSCKPTVVSINDRADLGTHDESGSVGESICFHDETKRSNTDATYTLEEPDMPQPTDSIVNIPQLSNAGTIPRDDTGSQQGGDVTTPPPTRSTPPDEDIPTDYEGVLSADGFVLTACDDSELEAPEHVTAASLDITSSKGKARLCSPHGSQVEAGTTAIRDNSDQPAKTVTRTTPTSGSIKGEREAYVE